MVMGSNISAAAEVDYLFPIVSRIRDKGKQSIAMRATQIFRVALLEHVLIRENSYGTLSDRER